MTWVLIVVFYATGFSAEFSSLKACQEAKAFVEKNAPGGLPKATCIYKKGTPP